MTEYYLLSKLDGRLCRVFLGRVTYIVWAVAGGDSYDTYCIIKKWVKYYILRYVRHSSIINYYYYMNDGSMYLKIYIYIFPRSFTANSRFKDKIKKIS